MEPERIIKKLLMYLDRPRTARAIGVRMRCSKPTAYKRINLLRKRGFKVKYKRVREGDSGPPARAFYVVL